MAGIQANLQLCELIICHNFIPSISSIYSELFLILYHIKFIIIFCDNEVDLA